MPAAATSPAAARRSFASRTVRTFGVALLALAGLTCRDRSLTGPGLTAPGKLRIVPSVAAAAAPRGPAFALQSVRVTLTPYPGDGDPVIDRVAAFADGGAELSMDFTVQLSQSSERFVLRVAATDAQAPHDTIFRSVDTVTVTAGTDAPTPQPIALHYDGADKDVASITLEPRDTVFSTMDAVQMRAVAKRADGTVVAGARFGYSVGDAAMADITGAGRLSAHAASAGFAGMWVYAGTGNGVADSVRITGRVPVVAVAVSPNGAQAEPILGTSFQLTAVVTGPNGVALTDRAVLWTTTNAQRATVSAAGLVTAGPDTGEVVVRVTSEGVSGELPIRVRPVPVAAVVIAPLAPALRVEVGDTVQLSAVAQGAAGQTLAGREITWGTTTPSIIQLLPDGRAIALAAGAAQATAISEGKTGTLAITVVPPAVVALMLSPDSVGVVRGGTAATAVTLLSKRNVALTGRAVTYAVTRPNAVSVNGTGVVTGLVAGDTASLIAESEGHADTVRVYVLPRPLGSITLVPETAALKVGETVTVAATPRDADGQPNGDFAVRFQSLSPSVASVDAATGVVTALAAGSATIRATAGTLTADATITVAPRVTGVRVSPRTPFLIPALGDTRQATAQAFAGQDAVDGAAFAWVAADPSVVSVDAASGQMTALANGTTYVIARLAEDTLQRDSVQVTVSQQVFGLALTPAAATRYAGTTIQYAAAATDPRGNAIPAAHAAPQLVWSTLSGGRTASVDKDGLATAVAVGTDSVVVTVANPQPGEAGQRAAAFLRVASPVTRVQVTRLTPGAGVIGALGTPIQLTAAALDTVGAAMPNVTFSWESSDPAVVRLDSVRAGIAYLHAAGGGLATVTATADGFGERGSEAVSVQQQLAQIRLEPAVGLTLSVGGTAAIMPQFYDAGGFQMMAPQQPVYSVINSQPEVPGAEVVRVDPSSGVVTATGNGTADVIATLGGVTSNAVRARVSGIAVQLGFEALTVAPRTSITVPVRLSAPPSENVVVRLRMTTLSGGGPNGEGPVSISNSWLPFARNVQTQYVTVTGLYFGTVRIAGTDTRGDDCEGPCPPPAILLVPDTGTVTVASGMQLEGGLSVALGDSGIARLVLTEPAPDGGLAVTFAYGTAGVAAVEPATVVVPPGHLAADVVIRPRALGTTTVTPVAAGTSGLAATVTVGSAELRLLTGGGARTDAVVVGAGQRAPNMVALFAPNPPGGALDVALDVPGGAAAVPRTVTLNGRAFYDYYKYTRYIEYFPVEGRVPGSGTITASAKGWTTATIPVIVTTPQLIARVEDRSYYGGDLGPLTLLTPNRYVNVTVGDTLGVTHPLVDSLLVRVRSSDERILTVDRTTVWIPTYPGAEAALEGRVMITARGNGSAELIFEADGHRPATVPFTVQMAKLAFATRYGSQPRDTAIAYAGHVRSGESWYEALGVRMPLAYGTTAAVTVTNLHPELARVTASLAVNGSGGQDDGGGNSFAPIDSVVGLAPGVDTLIASADGYLPDTLVVTVLRDRFVTQLASDTLELVDSLDAGAFGSASAFARSGHPLSASLDLTLTSDDPSVLDFGDGQAVARLRAEWRENEAPAFGWRTLAPGVAHLTIEAPGHEPTVVTVVVRQPRLLVTPAPFRLGVGQQSTRRGQPRLVVRRTVAVDQPLSLALSVVGGPADAVELPAALQMDADQPEVGLVLVGRREGTVQVEVRDARGAEGTFRPETLTVTVAKPAFVQSDYYEPWDQVPATMHVGDTHGFRGMPSDVVSAAAPDEYNHFVVNDVAADLPLRITSSNPEVVAIITGAERAIPAANDGSDLYHQIRAAGPGTATVTVQDSAGLYEPMRFEITVRAPKLQLDASVGDQKLTLGMRQTLPYYQRVCLRSEQGHNEPIPATLTTSQDNLPGRRVIVPEVAEITVPVPTYYSNCATFNLQSQDTVGTVALIASAPGYEPDTLVVEVGQPRLDVTTFKQRYAVGEANAGLSVGVRDHLGRQRVTLDDIAVRLTSTNPSAAAVEPAEVTVGAGSSGIEYPNFAAYLSLLAPSQGDVRVTASAATTAAGVQYLPGASTPPFTVVPAQLAIVPGSSVVGAQIANDGYRVVTQSPPAEDLVLDLVSSDPTVARAGVDTAVIRAGQTASEEYFSVLAERPGSFTLTPRVRYGGGPAAGGYALRPLVQTVTREGVFQFDGWPAQIGQGDSASAQLSVRRSGGGSTRVTSPVPVTFTLPPQLLVRRDGDTQWGSAVTVNPDENAVTLWILGASAGVAPARSVVAANPNFAAATTASATTVTPPFAGAAQTFAGNDHSCALDDKGAAWCWGSNGRGQLGDNSVEDRAAPVRVAGGLTFTQLAPGGSHTCALDAKGTAYCWGNNDNAQLGDGSVESRAVPTRVAGDVTFRMLDAGDAHTCGVSTGGTAYCWGWNGSGRLGDSTSENTRTTPVPVYGQLAFTSVSAGGSHTCALATDGAGYCWGYNGDGQVGDGTYGGQRGGVADRWVPTAVAGKLTFKEIGAGAYHSCGLAVDGTAYCWGDNNVWQTGAGSPPSDLTTPTAVNGSHVFTTMRVGGGSNCGLESGGSLWCWGINSDGRLGDGTTEWRLTPSMVAGGSRFSRFAIGDGHACGLESKGMLLCWGRNGSGQLGDRTTQTRLSPVRVLAPEDNP